MSNPVSTAVLLNRTSGDREASQPPETAKREIRVDVTTTEKRGEAVLEAELA
ncbi:hypothetical protein MOQ72_01095 [Saccharopolyspora sp. K220]|uniref:hypothetical protein n=1 Tax=Saccharopolyspora soli TaxID=2926618 RepID=UPI001F5A87EE|nr:hypothetical protein [Saccharopolyspora soli]MCI2416007.1 hypothetical protein [Saccharopolyspora soli]